ncbi:MAG TPA: DEAD/DEAH box helicase, partial [Bacteroidota bacterium]
MSVSYVDLVTQLEQFRFLRKRIQESSAGRALTVSGLHGSLLAAAAQQIADEGIEQVLIVCADGDKAETLRDDLSVFGNASSALYVHAHHHASTMLDMSGPVQNTETLRMLVEKKPVVVAAALEAVISPVPSPDVFRRTLLTIETGKEFPFQPFLSTLAELGFERKDFVEEYGDVAVRGGIVDVYSFLGEHPLRIEFWGDSVESIREFDVRSQRSIKNLSSATIAARLFGRESPGGGFILDYLARGAVFLLDEPADLQRRADELIRDGVEHILPWDETAARLTSFRSVVHTNFKSEVDIAFGGLPHPSLNGSIRFLAEELIRKSSEGYSIFLASDSAEEENRLKELLEEEAERTGATLPAVRYTTETIHAGFVLLPAKIAVFTEHQIFGRLKRRGSSRKARFKGLSQRELLRLKRGDYVVHTDYGIGRFAGLQTIQVRSVDQEVMKIQYEENDVLYVHLNFVNRVQKYSSRDGHEPALTHLGTPQWERLKSRAHKRVKDIARDLIALYARRKQEPGFAFSADSHWQKELEASFMYEDTTDQERATRDVKQDMMQPAPMDRLVCGDVGFGKTEVAVRAAFKAALDGKQVAVLVPTTILAQQHHHTFVDRLQRYTVRVESLTRFKSKKEQKQILAQLAGGGIDVIIGTHRLLSKDVTFKNLGLLIIDEEHRFGVSAKEKLRSLRASVDTLTLTATPIPRT